MEQSQAPANESSAVVMTESGSSSELPRDGGKPSDTRRQRRLEKSAELIVLALVIAFWGYILAESVNWPGSASLVPRLGVVIGIPALVLRLVAVFRRGSSRTSNASVAEIMDVGFRIGIDPAAEKRRLVRVVGYIVVLTLATWLFGARFAFPVGTVLYLYFFGKMGIVRSVITGAILLAVIMLVYDYAAHAPWPAQVFPWFGN